jgi:putative endonuclease
MSFVYALRSERNNKRYIGWTNKDVQARLSEHNWGNTAWTKNNSPFKLAFAQEFSTNKEARSFEKFLKSGQGRQCLDELGI